MACVWVSEHSCSCPNKVLNNHKISSSAVPHRCLLLPLFHPSIRLGCIRSVSGERIFDQRFGEWIFCLTAQRYFLEHCRQNGQRIRSSSVTEHHTCMSKGNVQVLFN